MHDEASIKLQSALYIYCGNGYIYGDLYIRSHYVADKKMPLNYSPFGPKVKCCIH